MSRLTRLTSILLHLQSRRVISSVELAEKFGISQRTVYRDIKALEEAGVPVIGEAGSGYCLVDDYRIPPVMFTEQELNSLLTAHQLINKQSDKSLQKNFEDLVVKIKALLKHSTKEKLETLENRVLIYGKKQDSKTDFLSSIQSAIINLHVIKIQYHTIYSNEINDRLVEPLAVYFTKENWIMIAYCRLRKDIREFRVDRILKLNNTNENFPDHQFSFEKYFPQQS